MMSFECKAKDYYGEVVINKGLMGKAGIRRSIDSRLRWGMDHQPVHGRR